MRVLAVALCVLAAWPVQALAQPQAAEGAPAAAQTAEIDPQAVAAATDLYRAIAIDSGGIDLLVNAAFAIHGPRIRQSVQSGIPYGSERWVAATARRLGVALQPRPRGRPRKQPKNERTPF